MVKDIDLNAEKINEIEERIDELEKRFENLILELCRRLDFSDVKHI